VKASIGCMLQGGKEYESSRRASFTRAEKEKVNKG
jgi:hypothetical protein